MLTTVSESVEFKNDSKVGTEKGSQGRLPADVELGQVIVVWCHLLKDKQVKAAMNQLLEHLYYNEGLALRVLDLRKSAGGERDAWQHWVRAPESLKFGSAARFEKTEVSVLEGGFSSWPRYSDQHKEELAHLIKELRKLKGNGETMHTVVLIDQYEPVRRSCLLWAKLADKNLLLVREGKTRLGRVKAVADNFHDEGIENLATLLVHGRNSFIQWINQLLE